MVRVCVCVVGENECLNIMHVILMKEINLEARTEKESDEKKKSNKHRLHIKNK